MRLLAAGRSVMGIKKKPGPYRMNQEHLLPRFAPVPKAAGSAAEPQESLETVAPASDLTESSGGSEPGASATPRPTQPEVRGGFLPRWAKRLAGLGRREKKEAKAPLGARLVQAELTLAAVKVVRNDLTDSDFELVPAARAQAAVRPTQAKTTAASQPMGIIWNRLSARLLRQATEDFNSVQKERGKLFTQAGPGAGSSRGT